MDELTKLFAAYRDAVPSPEPGPRFMPELWARIEARRSPARVLRNFAQAFAMLAAVTVLLIATVLIPRFQAAPVYSSSYVDVLENENAAEMAYADAPPPPEAARFDETLEDRGFVVRFADIFQRLGCGRISIQALHGKVGQCQHGSQSGGMAEAVHGGNAKPAPPGPEAIP